MNRMEFRRQAKFEGGPLDGRVLRMNFVGQIVVTPEDDRYVLVEVEGNTGEETLLYRLATGEPSKENE